MVSLELIGMAKDCQDPEQPFVMVYLRCGDALATIRIRAAKLTDGVVVLAPLWFACQ